MSNSAIRFVPLEKPMFGTGLSISELGKAFDQIQGSVIAGSEVRQDSFGNVIGTPAEQEVLAMIGTSIGTAPHKKWEWYRVYLNEDQDYAKVSPDNPDGDIVNEVNYVIDPANQLTEGCLAWINYDVLNGLWVVKSVLNTTVDGFPEWVVFYVESLDGSDRYVLTPCELNEAKTAYIDASFIADSDNWYGSLLSDLTSNDKSMYPKPKIGHYYFGRFLKFLNTGDQAPPDSEVYYQLVVPGTRINCIPGTYNTLTGIMEYSGSLSYSDNLYSEYNYIYPLLLDNYRLGEGGSDTIHKKCTIGIAEANHLYSGIVSTSTQFLGQGGTAKCAYNFIGGSVSATASALGGGMTPTYPFTTEIQDDPGDYFWPHVDAKGIILNTYSELAGISGVIKAKDFLIVRVYNSATTPTYTYGDPEELIRAGMWEPITFYPNYQSYYPSTSGATSASELVRGVDIRGTLFSQGRIYGYNGITIGNPRVDALSENSGLNTSHLPYFASGGLTASSDGVPNGGSSLLSYPTTYALWNGKLFSFGAAGSFNDPGQTQTGDPEDTYDSRYSVNVTIGYTTGPVFADPKVLRNRANLIITDAGKIVCTSLGCIHPSGSYTAPYGGVGGEPTATTTGQTDSFLGLQFTNGWATTVPDPPADGVVVITGGTISTDPPIKILDDLPIIKLSPTRWLGLGITSL
jgi:hypothetical protein